MAYEKQTWETGEVITAEKLNHMECGIGSCVVATTATYDDTDGSITLGLTWKEIHDILASGRIALAVDSDENFAAIYIASNATIYEDSGTTVYSVGDVSTRYSFQTDSENGYPAYRQGGGPI